ncbi:MAG TPA: hypothetical protein VGE08_09140 [Steroidobacter sp.]|uniref:hypothetical protein n=1 Tax=Steroidobacter sp. TaxID=1978227 RepID=UPI002ED9954D
MPSAGEILEGLANIAESWGALAVLWHIYCGLLVAFALFGFPAHNRLVGALLIPLLASVSVLAWVSGNPFNGTAFAALSITLVALLWNLSRRAAERAHPAWRLLGFSLVAFGWAYPHFLEEAPPSTYLYAAPLGLIPCPSLSLVVGVTIIFSGLDSRAWSLVLSFAALFYGVFGAVYLGVTIDWVLAGGGIGLLVLSIRRVVGRIARDV